MPRILRRKKGVMKIVTSKSHLSTKERILSVCVKLFWEKGYKKTTVAEIVELAEVSNSSFQHFFRAKDGILTELVHFMFDKQFQIARNNTAMMLPPVYTYALETAIQMVLTEQNENLREIYIEAYTHEEALNFIQCATTKELYHIFGPYQPELTMEDFYILDLGSSGLMRSYMVRRCDKKLTLEKKLRAFLLSVLRIFRVPEDEIREVLEFVAGLDLDSIAQRVLSDLFKLFAVRFELSE